MSVPEEATILIRLAGAREFIANANEEAVALGRLTYETDELGFAMGRTSERGYVANQALFTMRRLLYGATLGVIALGAEVIHLGFNYDSAMQQATVALRPVFSSTAALTKELNSLFEFTKYTPFQFKDVTTAFRQMYGAMHPLGISVQQVNFYIKALTDALSFAGKTTPAALNRVSVAFQHIAFLGHITGQQVTQLARDGLPVYAAFNKELGLTGAQIKDIGSLGISSSTALNAITKYIESTPGYEGAAKRLATGSLQGLFTTFKDNLSQLFGSFEMKPFLGAQNDFARLNAFLDKLTQVEQNGGGIKGIMNALAKALMPSNPGLFLFFWNELVSIVTNAWSIFTAIISTITHSTALWGSFVVALTALNLVLKWISANMWLIEPILKILIPMWIAWRLWLLYTAIQLKSVAFWTAVNTLEFKELTFWQALARTGLIAYNIAMDALSFGVIGFSRLWEVMMTGSVRGEDGRFLALTGLEKSMRALRGYILYEMIPAWTAFRVAVMTTVKTFAADMLIAIRSSKLYAGAIWLIEAAEEAWWTVLLYVEDALIAVRIAMATYVTELVLAFQASKLYTVWLVIMDAAEGLFVITTTAAATAMAALTLAILANPIVWLIALIVLLVAGLVILYFKWTWFHNEVNATFDLFKNGSFLVKAALTLAFGPLGLALTTIILIWKYWNDIKAAGNVVKNVAEGKSPSGNKSGGWLGGLEKYGSKALTPALYVATGGVYGEYKGIKAIEHLADSKKKIISTPKPNKASDVSTIFNNPEAWMNGNQNAGGTTHITVKIGSKKVGEAIAQNTGNLQARQ